MDSQCLLFKEKRNTLFHLKITKIRRVVPNGLVGVFFYFQGVKTKKNLTKPNREMQIIILLILFQRKMRGVVAHHSIIYCAVWKEERRRRVSLTQ